MDYSPFIFVFPILLFFKNNFVFDKIYRQSIIFYYIYTFISFWNITILYFSIYTKFGK